MSGKPSSTYHEIYVRLLDMINSAGADNPRLPSEANLAEQFGVSRVTIRDVLSELEAKGYVSRRRGVGTVVNRHILKETARLDIDNFYQDMIRKSGFAPSTSIKKLRLVRDIGETMAKALELEEDEQVYQVQKILAADAKPVMCINDYIPERYYHKEDIDIGLMEQSTFFFVQKYCGELLDTSITHVDTCLATGELAEYMQLPEGTPLLQLESVVYNINQVPLVYSMEYVNTKIITFSLQKRMTKFNYSETYLNADK